MFEYFCVLPAGEACRVRPADGGLAPHPTAVQASSTKLYSVYGRKPVVHRHDMGQCGAGGKRKNRNKTKKTWKTKKKKLLSWAGKSQPQIKWLKSSHRYKLGDMNDGGMREIYQRLNKGEKREKGEDKEEICPCPNLSLSLSIHFTLPPSALPTVSQRMDPYLSVLNYACHNSIMKQRKDGQPRNWHGIGSAQRGNVISFWSMIIMIPQYAFRLHRPHMIYL